MPALAKRWRRSDFLDPSPEFFEIMERNGYLEPEDLQ